MLLQTTGMYIHVKNIISKLIVFTDPQVGSSLTLVPMSSGRLDLHIPG